MPAAGGPARCASAASVKDRTWEPLHDDPETKQLLNAATNRQLSKRSAVVKNALRQQQQRWQQQQQQHRTVSSGLAAQAVGRAAGAADCRLGQRQQTQAAEQLMLSACGLEALASEFPSFAGRHTSSGQEATGIAGGGGGDPSECWYPALLPGLPRRPKTSGAASTRLETRLYAVAYCKQRVTSGSHRHQGRSQPTELRQQQQQLQLQQQPVSSEAAAEAAAATDAGRPVLAKVASAGVLCSSAVPLRSIVDDEEAVVAVAARSVDSLMQTTPRSIRAAIQSGQCTLEYDMSETVKSDLSPATLLRKYHRDKGLHYGQIKLALSRNQILEGAAIRDVEESRSSQTLERSQSLRLAGLRGSMPNMSFASADGIPPLQLPMPPVRSKLKGPLLVSGILHPGDESAGQTAGGASKARGGGPKEALYDEPRELAAPEPNGGQSVSQDFVSWQQLLGPQRIPTVTKPPTTSMHAPSGAAGFSTNSISLPQRRHQSKLAGSTLSGYSGSGGGGTSGQAKATRRPDSYNRLEAEPRYTDPFTGAPASVQTRLAELAALESETVRWEKAGGKTKKKGRERED